MATEGDAKYFCRDMVFHFEEICFIKKKKKKKKKKNTASV